MDTTLYVGLSHQMAMRRSLDIVSNNMANMNTTAFKREAVMFREYVVDMRETEVPVARRVSYVQDVAVIRDFREGDFRQTGNPLDLALDRNNFFRVQMPDGTERYTRNGHFKISEEGILVTSNGRPVLDENGAEIAFDPLDGDINISEDGTISTRGRDVIGRIAVVTFDDLNTLEKVGDSLYDSAAEPVPADNFTVLQGMVEASNVEPLMEMTRMIEISRRYQSVARMLEDQQSMQSKSINRLARVE